MTKYFVSVAVAMAAASIGAWLVVISGGPAPCADAQDSPMGRTYVSAPSNDYTLKWDADCKSGVRWTKR